LEKGGEKKWLPLKQLSELDLMWRGEQEAFAFETGGK
jgi:hypothetical protein